MNGPSHSVKRAVFGVVMCDASWLSHECDHRDPISVALS